MDTALHSRLAESPVYFKADGETLLGILTAPRGRPTDTAAIVLTGRGFPSPNRNRLSVHLCRSLADLGCATLRFDYHGIGESTGVAEDFDLAKPFVNDLEGAVTCLREEGFKRFVFIGSCFGARTALSLAPEISGLEGVVLLAVPLHEDAGAELAFRLSTTDYVRRATRIKTLRRVFDTKHRRRYISLLKSKIELSGQSGRVSRSPQGRTSMGLIDSFSTSLADILARGTRVLLVYGTGDRYYRQFKKAAELGLRSVIDEGGELVQVAELDGKVHGFTRIEIQTQVIETVSSWFRAHLTNAPIRPSGDSI